MIGLHSYSRQVFIIWTPFWFISVFEIAVCFLWLSLPGDYRVIDEALLAETT